MPKCDFIKIEITLRHGCSPVNLLHVLKTPSSNNTSGRAASELFYRFIVLFQPVCTCSK